MRTKDLATHARAQTLRAEMTDPERKLWYRVRARRLSGHKFVRQMPIGRYFADFACREVKLVVELDGSQHAASEHDVVRDAFSLREGFRVLRVWNEDVMRNIDNVCETILAAIDGRLAPSEQYKVPHVGEDCA